MTYRRRRNGDVMTQRLEWYGYKPVNADSYQKLEEARTGSILEPP